MTFQIRKCFLKWVGEGKYDSGGGSPQKLKGVTTTLNETATITILLTT